MKQTSLQTLQSIETIFPSLSANINLQESQIVEAKTIKDGFLPSGIHTAQFTIEPIAETPIILPEDRGSKESPLNHPVSITIFTNTPNCTIFATFDDSPVSSTSTE